MGDKVQVNVCIFRCARVHCESVTGFNGRMTSQIARWATASALVLAVTAACTFADAPVHNASATTTTTATSATRPGVQLTPQQQAGQRVIYSYPGLTPPATCCSTISAGPGRRRDLLRREHLQRRPRSPAVVEQLRQATAAEPGQRAAAADDRPGGRPGPPAARRAGAVGEADRRSPSNPAPAAAQAGTGAGQNLARRRHERQPRAGARRLPHARQLHRPVPALVQQEPGDRRAPAAGVHQRPAGPGWPPPPSTSPASAPRPRARTPTAAGDAERVAVRPALRRRGALPGGDRGRREAGHGVLGGLPGAGRATARPACRSASSARNCAAASASTA